MSDFLDKLEHHLAEDYYEFAWGNIGDTEEVPGLGLVELVSSEPGGEGHGEHIYFVVKVGHRYLKKTGYYASYAGSDWDGPFTEVRPTVREVTFYE